MKEIKVSGGNIPIFIRELKNLQEHGGQLKTELFYIDADAPGGIELRERLVPIEKACEIMAKAAGEKLPNEYYLPKVGDTFEMLVYFARAKAYVHFDPNFGTVTSSKHQMYCIRQTTCRMRTFGVSWHTVKQQVLAREPGHFSKL